MPKGWRRWQLVVRALERLGCVVYASDDSNVRVARANVHFVVVRKWWFALEAERDLVAALRLDWNDYLRALDEP